MQFFYYLPGRGKLDLKQMRDVGLGYAFDKAPVFRGTSKGPAAQAGGVYAGSTDGLGYFSETQVWKKIPGLKCEAWVGMVKDKPPTPEELAREKPINGQWIVTEGGGRWLAPKARRFEEFDDEILWAVNFPQRLTLNDSGQWAPGDVKPRYQRLWLMAMDYLDAMQKALQESDDEKGEVRFNYEPIDELAIAALQCNYRISAAELDLLGVYDLQVRRDIIDALLDSRRYGELVKKKESKSDQSGSSFSSGPELSSPAEPADTDRPSPTSAPSPTVSTDQTR